MNITFHYPTSKKELENLSKKVALTYANAVFEKVNKLNCSKEQKVKILNSIK